MALLRHAIGSKSGQRRPKIKLSIREAGAETRELIVEKFPTSIGRSRENDLCVADGWVSRVHCQLQFAGARFVIRDLESANGTWVNRARVEERALERGDLIEIGLTRLSVLDLEIGR